jgi:hypothetical protein
MRAELNRRLADGEPGKRLVAWLNSLPEARAVLAAEFAGRPITENNLSEWKTGGFRDWERQQDLLATARNLAEQADELRAVAGGLTDHLALVVTARYAAALTDGDGPVEGGMAKELRWLQVLCADLVELRRGDHSAARLRLEQERREAEREKSDEETFGLFERWATMPALRELLMDPRLPAAERKRRLRELFGGPAGPIAAVPAAPSEPVRAEQSEGQAAAPESEARQARGEAQVSAEETWAGGPAADAVAPRDATTEAGTAAPESAGRPAEVAGATVGPEVVRGGGAWGDAGKLGRGVAGRGPIRPNPTESGPRFGSEAPMSPQGRGQWGREAVDSG